MHLPSSLLAELPAIITEGRQDALEAVRRATANNALEVNTNVLMHGDNLGGLARLVASGARAKLVYLDPPFDSKADYRSRIHTSDDDGAAIALEMHTYTDRWAGGTAEYLRMLVPRLVLASELVTEDGAICVHLDWHSSHYVRVVLDEVFGRDNFVNSLVWSYRTGGASRTRAVPRKHDDLLIYRRSESFRVTPLYERQYLDKPFMNSRVDAQGRHFVDTILRDVLEGAITLVDEAPETGLLPETERQSVHEVSVRPVLNLSAERTGYATQKPAGLLEILLRWMTHPGDLVVDPFGGSGTTATTAQRMGRRWVSMDASARSLVVSRSRLDTLDADYQLTSVEGQTVALDTEIGWAASEARPEPLATYAWQPTHFDLHAVQWPTAIAARVDPARGQSADSAQRAFDGTGLGALAGWQLWVESGEHRIAGAWRDARGHLVTSVPLAPAAGSTKAILELIDLTGERVAMCVKQS